jgi:hypothetical protein
MANFSPTFCIDIKDDFSSPGQGIGHYQWVKGEGLIVMHEQPLLVLGENRRSGYKPLQSLVGGFKLFFCERTGVGVFHTDFCRCFSRERILKFLNGPQSYF